MVHFLTPFLTPPFSSRGVFARHQEAVLRRPVPLLQRELRVLPLLLAQRGPDRRRLRRLPLRLLHEAQRPGAARPRVVPRRQDGLRPRRLRPHQERQRWRLRGGFCRLLWHCFLSSDIMGDLKIILWLMIRGSFINAAPIPPPDCGLSASSRLSAQRRIVGGTEAGFGSFPWTVRSGTELNEC